MPVVKILSPKSSPGSVALAKIASDVSPVLGAREADHCQSRSATGNDRAIGEVPR